MSHPLNCLPLTNQKFLFAGNVPYWFKCHAKVCLFCDVLSLMHEFVLIPVHIRTQKFLMNSDSRSMYAGTNSLPWFQMSLQDLHQIQQQQIYCIEVPCNFPLKEEWRPRLNHEPANDPNQKPRVGDVVKVSPAIPDESLTEYCYSSKNAYSLFEGSIAYSMEKQVNRILISFLIVTEVTICSWSILNVFSRMQI